MRKKIKLCMNIFRINNSTLIISLNRYIYENYSEVDYHKTFEKNNYNLSTKILLSRINYNYILNF